MRNEQKVQKSPQRKRQMSLIPHLCSLYVNQQVYLLEARLLLVRQYIH